MRALFMMAEMVDQPFDQQREQLDGDHDEDQGESSASPMGQGGKAVRERGLEPEGGGFASRPRRMATASAIRRGSRRSIETSKRHSMVGFNRRLGCVFNGMFLRLLRSAAVSLLCPTRGEARLSYGAKRRPDGKITVRGQRGSARLASIVGHGISRWVWNPRAPESLTASSTSGIGSGAPRL